MEELANTLIHWLREHAQMAQKLGPRCCARWCTSLVGCVIGAMVALYRAISKPNRRPLAAALVERARMLQRAFAQFIFAQVQIS